MLILKIDVSSTRRGWLFIVYNKENTDCFFFFLLEYTEIYKNT